MLLIRFGRIDLVSRWLISRQYVFKIWLPLKSIIDLECVRILRAYQVVRTRCQWTLQLTEKRDLRSRVKFSDDINYRMVPSSAVKQKNKSTEIHVFWRTGELNWAFLRYIWSWKVAACPPHIYVSTFVSTSSITWKIRRSFRWDLDNCNDDSAYWAQWAIFLGEYANLWSLDTL